MSILVEYHRADFEISPRDERGQSQAPRRRHRIAGAGATKKPAAWQPRACGHRSFGPWHFNGERLSQERRFLPKLKIGRQHLLNGLDLRIVLAIEAADRHQAAGAHMQYISVQTKPLGIRRA